ncbi:MAG: 5-formyltetrahydrofolate cyclo-ligase, partial [Actinobacteria bacterium]|nr:5-formyltetrahydrofolate cyclo-ligase [Actinomycetota bacterium]
DCKKIILPRVWHKNLELYFIENYKHQLKKSNYGIMEPVPELCKPAEISDIDLAIVPGVCFDKNLNRLGYGGGFYDKLLTLLNNNVKKIALCFEMQMLPEIPVLSHDIKIDEIITESNIYGVKTNIAILLPAYNEGKYIKDVLAECLPYRLDLIIIDDGSTDNTIEIIEKFPKPVEPKIILIKHQLNKGKGEALKTGFAFAAKNNYSGVITLDADGQHKVSEIEDFIRMSENENPDIIVGSRFKNTKGMPFIRLATNFFTSWLISAIAGKKIDDVQSGFRYVSLRALKNINLETKNFDTEPEMLLKASWLNYIIKNIPISTIYHKDFVSHVNPIKDTIKFFKLVFRSLKWKKSFKRSHTTL